MRWWNSSLPNLVDLSDCGDEAIHGNDPFSSSSLIVYIDIWWECLRLISQYLLIMHYVIQISVSVHMTVEFLRLFKLRNVYSVRFTLVCGKVFISYKYLYSQIIVSRVCLLKCSSVSNTTRHIGEFQTANPWDSWMVLIHFYKGNNDILGTFKRGYFFYIMYS